MGLNKNSKYQTTKNEILHYFKRRCRDIGFKLITLTGSGDVLAEGEFYYQGLSSMSKEQQSQLCLNYAKELKRHFKRNYVTIHAGDNNRYYDLFIRVSKSFIDLVPKNARGLKHVSTVNILVGSFQDTKTDHIGISLSLGGVLHGQIFDEYLEALNSNQSLANPSMFVAELKMIIDTTIKALRLTEMT